MLAFAAHLVKGGKYLETLLETWGNGSADTESCNPIEQNIF